MEWSFFEAETGDDDDDVGAVSVSVSVSVLLEWEESKSDIVPLSFLSRRRTTAISVARPSVRTQQQDFKSPVNRGSEIVGLRTTTTTTALPPNIVRKRESNDHKNHKVRCRRCREGTNGDNVAENTQCYHPLTHHTKTENGANIIRVDHDRES